MGFDMNKLMQQAAQMQAQMAQAQEELAHETVEASAGGGTVTVVATGGLEIKEIRIAPEAIDPDDPETLEDLLVVAVNSAMDRSRKLAEQKMGALTAGMKIPGLF